MVKCQTQLCIHKGIKAIQFHNYGHLLDCAHSQLNKTTSEEMIFSLLQIFISSKTVQVAELHISFCFYKVTNLYHTVHCHITAYFPKSFEILVPYLHVYEK